MNKPMGGGEVLHILDKIKQNGTQYLDNTIVQSFALLPYIKITIYLLLIAIMIILILRIFNIKTILRNKGVAYELSNVENIISRDKYILKSNKILRTITKIVQKTPFNLPYSSKEYWQYNIDRVGIKAPGGLRYLSAEEFNAIIRVIEAGLLAISIIIAIFINSVMGIVMLISTIVCCGTLPILIIRAIVADKDREIKDNFTDFYLMIHYVLMSGGSTPLEKIMRSYAKTTTSEEMRRFIDRCIDHIDIHQEYNATKYIAKDYREIAQVSRLMRLIRQQHEGGNISEELLGFRNELIKEKKYSMERRRDRLVSIASNPYVTYIILIQAIISAMAIYLPDIVIIKSIFGM